MSIITSKNVENTEQFIVHLIEVARRIKNIEVIIFDAEQMIQNNKVNIKEEYQNFISKMQKDAKEKNKKESIMFYSRPK